MVLIDRRILPQRRTLWPECHRRWRNKGHTPRQRYKREAACGADHPDWVR